MKSEPTSAKVVDHCDRLKRGNFLSGFTVEDSNMIQITKVSGLRLLDPGLMHFKMWLLGENEDLVVSLDVQINLGRAALSIDTRDGEVFDVGDLCGGDHGQVDHSICRTGHYLVIQAIRTFMVHQTRIHKPLESGDLASPSPRVIEIHNTFCYCGK